MTYMAMGIHVVDGTPQTPSTRYYDDRNQAERQFHLYCAAAATSEYETDTAILMTVDGQTLERKVWHHVVEVTPEEETTE